MSEILDAILSNLGVFSVTVTRENGTPIQGAFVRVLDSVGNDVTLQLTGDLVGITGADGYYVKVFPAPGPLPAAFYRVQVSVQGFQTALIGTAPDFKGKGRFPIALTQNPLGNYSIVPTSTVVSPIVPCGIDISGPAPAATQYIECTIAGDTGTSKIEVPVSPDGSAYIGLDGRLNLPAKMNLVPDGQAFIIDPDFARPFSLTYALVDDSGSRTINVTTNLIAVNVYPSGLTNDLSGLTGWITPAPVLAYAGPTVSGPLMADMPTIYAKQGYYQDAMILIRQAGTYAVYTDFIGANGVISQDMSATIASDGKRAFRVRIPAPVSGAVMAVVSVSTVPLGSVSQRLRVVYNG